MIFQFNFQIPNPRSVARLFGSQGGGGRLDVSGMENDPESPEEGKNWYPSEAVKRKFGNIRKYIQF